MTKMDLIRALLDKEFEAFDKVVLAFDDKEYEILGIDHFQSNERIRIVPVQRLI
jgi:hypothetical protein